MRESPRTRRLKSDFRALQQLRADSSIVDFVATGDPAESYLVRFRGQGLWRPADDDTVCIREDHEVSVQLGASYPRMMPELSWKTPIFHPNISAGGIVCLGGYGTHWVPSVSLAELCHMLWDMIRYKNFDVESPYNREASSWTKEQLHFQFPLDPRPLRDKKAGMAPDLAAEPLFSSMAADGGRQGAAEVTFLENEIIDAEIIEAEIVEAETVQPDSGPEILFID